MSQFDLTALLTTQAALELARAKAAKLLKEIEYTKNRYTRAEEEAARLQKELNLLKTGQPLPASQPEPAPAPAATEPAPVKLSKAERRALKKADAATQTAKVA